MAFAKQYDENELIRLKQIEIDILRDIIAVCEKHNIRYFAVYGTLIGAMRHEGFIPWDDDLDIGMCREDYNKFKAVFDKEMGDKYIFATPSTLKGYCSSVTKVMLKGTRFVPSFSKNMKCELGIHVDIFIFDRAEKESKRLRWDVLRSRFCAQLLFLVGSPNPIIDNTSLIGKIEVVVCKLIHYLISWIPGLPQLLYRGIDDIGKKSNGKCGHYLTSFFDNVPLKEIAPVEEIFPLKMAKFEGMNINIPANPNAVLTRLYGDYMQLPPVEERVNHCADTLDFGIYSSKLK